MYSKVERHYLLDKGKYTNMSERETPGINLKKYITDLSLRDSNTEQCFFKRALRKKCHITVKHQRNAVKLQSMKTKVMRSKKGAQ